MGLALEALFFNHHQIGLGFSWLCKVVSSFGFVPGNLSISKKNCAEKCPKPSVTLHRKRMSLVHKLHLRVGGGCFPFFIISHSLVGWDTGMRRFSLVVLLHSTHLPWFGRFHSFPLVMIESSHIKG